jgi:acetyl/propionyl-CoA carboxylase alpha subunit
VDSACEPGQEVTVHYDPLLAKLIARGRTRGEAIARLRRALDEYAITGVRTTLPFHRWLVRDEAFLAGELSTSFVDERWTADAPERAEPLRDALRAAAVAVAHDAESRRMTVPSRRSRSVDGSRWRAAGWREALR